jgi:predicted  nucleic acid-binding Zn-ribbon protein
MKQLPSGHREIEVAAKPETPDETIQRLNRRVRELEGRLAGAQEEFRQLQKIYTQLSDQWMAFQAVHRPTNRNCQRAEAVGEFSRRMVENLIQMHGVDQVRALATLFIQTAYPAEEFGR